MNSPAVPANFKILVADDERVHRMIAGEALRMALFKVGLKVPEENIKFVANVAQAEHFFQGNREGCKALFIVDGDMSRSYATKYVDTSYDIPQTVTGRQDFEGFLERAREWCDGTVNECLLVRRSGGDPKSTKLARIGLREVNNFNDPIYLSKHTKVPNKRFKAVLEHCKKLFALPV